jgi:hypothetical protein
MYDQNHNKRKTPIPPKGQDDDTPLPEKTLERTHHLTDTAALVRKVNADLVRDAKAEFAAVMEELNKSRNRDKTTQLGNTQAEEDEDDI